MKNSKVTKIAIGVLAIAVVGSLSYFMIGKLNENKQGTKEELKYDYVGYLYKKNGEISSYDVVNNKNLEIFKQASSEIKVVNDRLINPYKLKEYNNKIYALDHTSKTVIVYDLVGRSLKEAQKISVSNTPVEFKIYQDNLYVSFLESNAIEVINLKDISNKKILKASANITGFEVDDKYLYCGVSKDIEMISLKNSEDKTKIFLGHNSLEMLKAKDGYLYVLNNFASDNANSVMFKIDVDKKHVEDLVELGKENPIGIVESPKNLYVLCKGLEDISKDGLAIVSKSTLRVVNRIATSHNPNSMFIDQENYLYVTHDNGEIVRIDTMKNTIASATRLLNVKSLIIKPFEKEVTNSSDSAQD